MKKILLSIFALATVVIIPISVRAATVTWDSPTRMSTASLGGNSEGVGYDTAGTYPHTPHQSVRIGLCLGLLSLELGSF